MCPEIKDLRADNGDLGWKVVVQSQFGCGDLSLMVENLLQLQITLSKIQHISVRFLLEFLKNILYFC